MAGRLDRVASGVVGAGLAVMVVFAWRLYSDVTRDNVGKPVPIYIGNWVER